MARTPVPVVRGIASAGMAILLNLHPSALSGQGAPHQFREVHLGMEVTLTAFGPRGEVEQAATAAFGRIEALEQVLSDWRPTSELNRIAAGDTARWHPVSADLERVLVLALRVAAASDGAFDPTIGALTRLWREQRRSGVAPAAATVHEARRSVGWRGLVLDTLEHRVRLSSPATRLDLGGIAKGWILGEALAVLARHGVSAAMIEAGGDLVTGDPPPGTVGWRISVRTAQGDSVVVVHHAALATSGPAAQWIVDADGRRQSHVIDPFTGRGIDNGFEVTVLAADGAMADAVATALTVMPRSRWAGLMARFGVELVAVVNGEW